LNDDKKGSNALYERGHEFIHNIRTELFCIEISNKSLSLYLPQLLELYQQKQAEGLNTFTIPEAHFDVINSSSKDIKSQLDSINLKTSLFLDSLNKQPKAQSQSRLTPLVDKITQAKALSVLLVEDEEIHRDIARHVLDPSNCDFTLVEDGFEALNRLKQEHYDLILIDLHMPKWNGNVMCNKSIKPRDVNHAVFLILN